MMTAPVDLRAFLQLLEAKGQLRRVKVEVDPRFEIGAICRKLQDENGPAVLFERVKGSRIPLVSNLLSNRERIAALWGASAAELPRLYGQRSHPQHYRGPRPSEQGAPCKEVIRLGDEVDVTELPSPIWNEGDAGPYITFGVLRVKDPTGHLANLSVNRLQVKGPRKLGIWTAEDRDLGRIMRMWWAQGKAMPVSIVIGCEPTYVLAACDHLSFGTDEMVLASALRGEPVPVVKSETNDLEVPASAEIVLEGEIPPGVLEPEGPYGEMLGYYGPQGPMPVININAMTHRRDPICLGSYEGMPEVETHTIQQLQLENGLRFLLGFVGPTIRDVHVSPTSGGMNAYVSIEKVQEGDARQVLLAMQTLPLIKHAVVFDPDIQIRDPGQREWALATRVNPARDVMIFDRVRGLHLDPTAQRVHPETLTTLTSRMGIDATVPLGSDFPKKITFSAETMRHVTERWKEYGF